MISPTRLVVFDFDGALYQSPGPPPGVTPSSWWLGAHSLASAGAPGFDSRWVLEAVREGRKMKMDPFTFTALLTGRPNHRKMLSRIHELLEGAHLDLDVVQLKPIKPWAPTPIYKASFIQKWILNLPTVGEVIFYDDEPENHVEVKRTVERLGRIYVGLYGPGVS